MLLAEDNPLELLLLQEAFQNAELAVEIVCVPDGDQLLQRLRLAADGQESYGLVVLDVHLPKRSASEVLMALKSENRRLEMPVVVLTTLISEADKTDLLKLGVHEILSKPSDLNEYFVLSTKLSSFFPS